MSVFLPKKLYVKYFPGVTLTHPVINRHYILTHSDETGDLFLSMSLKYIYNQISKNRDEVLAQWSIEKNKPVFHVYIHVDSQPVKNISDSTKRLSIFKKELPLALKAIRFGDRILFNKYPCLDCANIIIYFVSVYPALRSTENWGCFTSFAPSCFQTPIND